ncbi:MAG: 4-hydroxybenzoate octaprenyltransferase, partial [Legionella sp.]|nr:4-hydroxybenzoate octaprenyltransferase [Legionella sp.]
MKLTPYFELLRLHKPIGTLLLWFPTAWALWLASHGKPPALFVLYFFLGTFIMRSAGCLLNDIADRHIDPHVERTKNRPLAAQQISLQAAMALLIFLLFTAFIILAQLPKACFNYALISIALTAVYPFCKRFFEAPQLVLGLAFSMGIPMAFTAVGTPLNLSVLLLMLLNFCWIMAYDTIYALADRPDDLEIGVKS